MAFVLILKLLKKCTIFSSAENSPMTVELANKDKKSVFAQVHSLKYTSTYFDISSQCWTTMGGELE